MTGGAQESEMQLEMSRKEGALPLGPLEDDLRNGGLFWTKCEKHVQVFFHGYSSTCVWIQTKII